MTAWCQIFTFFLSSVFLYKRYSLFVAASSRMFPSVSFLSIVCILFGNVNVSLDPPSFRTVKEDHLENIDWQPRLIV